MHVNELPQHGPDPLQHQEHPILGLYELDLTLIASTMGVGNVHADV